MISFNADEVFEMAEQIERNGAKFYRKAADSADKENVAALLEMAAMEDDHEKTFSRMRSQLTSREKTPVTFDPEGVGGLYLQAMTDAKVFNYRADPSERLTGKESIEEIYRTAIGLEKDSIVFYLGMKDLVPRSESKDWIDQIIKQEMDHISRLSTALSAVTA